MNGIHPKLIRAAMCAVFAASFGGGCKSTSSGIANNPFMAPDRVAPPSTRVLAPGQAQPYYQGDPLPVMQSATTPPAAAALATDDAAARSATGKTLAWNSPAGGSPTPPTAPPPSALAAAPWDATLTNHQRPHSLTKHRLACQPIPPISGSRCQRRWRQKPRKLLRLRSLRFSLQPSRGRAYQFKALYRHRTTLQRRAGYSRSLVSRILFRRRQLNLHGEHRRLVRRPWRHQPANQRSSHRAECSRC